MDFHIAAGYKEGSFWLGKLRRAAKRLKNRTTCSANSSLGGWDCTKSRSMPPPWSPSMHVDILCTTYVLVRTYVHYRTLHYRTLLGVRMYDVRSSTYVKKWGSFYVLDWIHFNRHAHDRTVTVLPLSYTSLPRPHKNNPGFICHHEACRFRLSPCQRCRVRPGSSGTCLSTWKFLI